MSRYARRLSAVDSSAIESNRFSIVPELSSAARIPLLSATSAFAVSCSSLAAMAVSFHQSSDLLGRVVGGDPADGPGAGAHHDRLGLDAAAADADAAEKRAARDAGGSDEDVVPRDQVVGREDAVDVVPALDELLPLLVVPRPELALDRPAEALDRGSGDDAFGGAADPHQHVDAGERLGGGDRGRDVAVANEVHARAGVPQLADQPLVPLALEHDDGHLAHVQALRPGDRAHVLGWGSVDVDRAGGLAPHGDLVHVERRAGVEHRPPLGDGDDGDRIRLAERRQAGALEWVDRDVPGRAAAVSDLLAVVEHGRLVLLTLPDHDRAVHPDGVEDEPHRVDRGAVGLLLLAAADPAGRGERGGLRDADELEREVPVRGFGLGAHAARSYPRRYIRSGASTPTRSRQRAITDRVAVTSPSRNASASEPSTLWRW